MAAVTNANNATIVADATLTEIIDRVVRRDPRSPYVYRAIAYIPPLLVNSKRFSTNVHDIATASAAHTETDEVASFAITPTRTNIDTALYAKGAIVGDWGNMLGVYGQAAIVAAEVREAIELRFETDVLALSSSFTNTTGSATTVMTIDNLVAVTAGFRAVCKVSTMPPIMILSIGAMGQLQSDVMKTGGSLFSTLIGPQLAAAVGGASIGSWGAFGGFMIGSTDRMPAGDTTGKRNIIVSMPEPETAALALPFSMAPTYDVARATASGRTGMWIIGQHAHGAGIIQQARAYNFTTSAAAA